MNNLTFYSLTLAASVLAVITGVIVGSSLGIVTGIFAAAFSGIAFSLALLRAKKKGGA